MDLNNIISIKLVTDEGEKNIYDKLYDKDESEEYLIKRSHIDKEVIEFLKNNTTNICKKILVEYPYSDRDYLSSVYAYYVKSRAVLDKTCYRLHFFDCNNYYYGFLVLRPTPFSHIDRIQADPRLFLKVSAQVITSNSDCAKTSAYRGLKHA